MQLSDPCSIHDIESALDYAGKLAVLRNKYKDKLCIIMRVYFEKPRTALGWRGLILDPDMDGSYKLEEGLIQARKLLLSINEMGLPAGSEILDPIVPQYISDLYLLGSYRCQDNRISDTPGAYQRPVHACGFQKRNRRQSGCGYQRN